MDYHTCEILVEIERLSLTILIVDLNLKQDLLLNVYTQTDEF